MISGRCWTGTAWRNLYRCFAACNSVCRQFRRWRQAGPCDAFLEALNDTGAGNDSVRMIDSTVFRAHQHAAGAARKGIRSPGVSPVSGWLLDQHPSPRQRTGPPRGSHAERRAGLGCRRLCADDGSAWPAAARPARRQGMLRRPYPAGPGGSRRRRSHSRMAKPKGPARHRRQDQQPAKTSSGAASQGSNTADAWPPDTTRPQRASPASSPSHPSGHG